MEMTQQIEISRVLRSKQRARAAYDQLSRWYDRLSVSSEWPMNVFGLYKLNVTSGETVLEIGFGTGNALLVLAKAASPTGRVFGIDISLGMSDVARKKIIHAGLADLIDFQQGDAAALPFRADSFDALFLSFTLELFDTPEMPAVLAECRRVLKPNGRICVVALARDSRANMSLRIYEWFHQYLPAYADCRPIDVPSTLQQAGFKIQDVTRKGMWGLPVEICLAQKEDAQ